MSEYLWVDNSRKKLTAEQIDDRYLTNIMNYLCRGGGYVTEIDESHIIRIFQEAVNRGIKHNFNIEMALASFKDKRRKYHQRLDNIIFADEIWFDGRW